MCAADKERTKMMALQREVCTGICKGTQYLKSTLRYSQSNITWVSWTNKLWRQKGTHKLNS